MSTVCSHCGGSDIEYDQARGDAVCTSCGSVLEDNIIVSEVTFQEQSTGSSTVIGQFVSAEHGKVPLSGTGFHHGMGKNSREVTLQQAKKRLTTLGNLLKLNPHHIDSAFMFFKMALTLNLTRGRKSSIIDTACLYLVCRSEGTPHLLLDFSDVLQINVYALGRAYLKLSNALHINPPAIDPCLYIHRFAHKLELADKTHDVAMTAMRLVCRMKRDWIHHGRRPAGLCGAALLVAARLHNFNRSVKEIAKVVKLSEGTIRKRLGDFKDTASSRLTIDEFLKIDLEQEHDPPSFTEAKKKAKQQAAADSEDSDNSANDSGTDNEEPEAVGGGFGGIVMTSVQDVIAKARLTEAFMNAPTAGLSNNLDELAKLVDETEEEKVSCDPDSLEGGAKELEDVDDEEIENILLSEEEVRIKTRLWFAENADYLKEQEERKERLAALKAAKGDKPKKKYNKRKQKTQYAPASTAGEAIERMLVEKKISSKINYDVLRNLDQNLTEDRATTSASLESREEPVAMEMTPEVAPSRAIGGRLPSLHSRKRTFSSLSGSTTQYRAPSKLSRTQPSSQSTVQLQEIITPLISHSQSGQQPPAPLLPPHIQSLLPPHLQSQRTPSTDRTVSDKPDEESRTNTRNIEEEASLSLVTAEGLSVDREVVIDEPEVVEESGPVEYSEGEEEEEGDIDDLAYEGDPLLNSDYEDAGEYED